MTEFDDTVAAIATPPGEGGVGIVRMSGPDALAIAARLFVSSRGKDILAARQRVFHGHVRDGDGRVLDEALLHRMRAPHSFTREDVVEINAHGGPGPLNAILEECLRQGARLARPGEFTQRAFLNGRIDLVQAEAVIDQIRARTHAGLQAANAAAAGVLSRAIHGFRDEIAHVLAHIEAVVDFPEDDLPAEVSAELLDRLRAARIGMEDLLRTADAGRLYREGAVVAIAGRPNVGKSSLFNALLREARAIVTPHEGTTRDRLDEYLNIGGVPVRLVDTAGLRDTADEVERIGVERAREALQSAQIVLFVVDAAAGWTEEDAAVHAGLAALEAPVVWALNKIDQAPGAAAPEAASADAHIVRLSALTGEGVPVLEEKLAEMLLGGVGIAADAAMLNRAHQKDSLRRAAECVDRVLAEPELSPEFLALELQEALQALGEITGETTPDDLLETIFASFCIGK